MQSEKVQTKAVLPMELTSAQTDLAYACVLIGLYWPWESVVDDLTQEDGSQARLPGCVNEALYPAPFAQAGSFRNEAKLRKDINLRVRRRAKVTKPNYATGPSKGN